jgi:hypothetical protein
VAKVPDKSPGIRAVVPYATGEIKEARAKSKKIEKDLRKKAGVLMGGKHAYVFGWECFTANPGPHSKGIGWMTGT